MIVLFLVLGKVGIWLISVAKPARGVWDFFDRCSLCAGFWVYLLLAWWFPVNLLSPVPRKKVLTEVATAALATTAVFIFSEGWKALWHAPNE